LDLKLISEQVWTNFIHKCFSLGCN